MGLTNVSQIVWAYVVTLTLRRVRRVMGPRWLERCVVFVAHVHTHVLTWGPFICLLPKGPWHMAAVLH